MGNDNVVGLLGSMLGCLQLIVKNTSPSNKKAEGKDVVASLNKGSLDAVASNSSSGQSDSGSKGGSTMNVSSIAGVVNSLKDISPTIKLIAGLSNRTINQFEKTVTKLVETLNGIQEKSKVTKETAETTNLMITCLSNMGSVVKSLSASALLAPIALIGVVMLTPVMLLFGKLLDIIGGFKNIDKGVEVLKGMKGFGSEMIKFLLVSVLTVGIAIGLGLLLKKHKELIGAGFIGLGAMAVASIVVIGLTFIAGLLIKETKAPENMLKMMGFLFLAGLFVMFSAAVGHVAIEHFGEVSAGFGCVVVVIGAALGLAAAAGAAAKHAKRGVIALSIMMGLIGAAMALTMAAVGISELTKGKWGEIAIGLAGVSTILVAMTLLALAAAAGAEYIIAGAIALAAVEVVAFAAIGLVAAIIKLNKYKDDSGMGWKEIAKTAAGVTMILTEISALCALALVVAVPAALAAPALAIVSVAAMAMIGVVAALISLGSSLEKSGGVENMKKLINEDIPSIMQGFNIKNFGLGMSAIEIGKLLVKYAALGGLMLEFAGIATVLSGLAFFGQMVSSDGSQIRPILHRDPATGELTFGEYVSMATVATCIASSVEAFAENCSVGIDSAKKIIESSGAFAALAIISGPISTFIGMLTNFVPVGGKLAPVRIDKDGNYTVGEPVDVVATAGIITGAITAFTNALYSEENVKLWSEKAIGKGGRQARRGLKKTMGVLGPIMEPLSVFFDMLSKYKIQGTTVTPISFDSEGNMKYGDPVDVAKSATGIVECINVFAGNVYGADKLLEWAKSAQLAEDTFGQFTSPLEKITAYAKDYSNTKVINSTVISQNTKAMHGVIELLADKRLIQGSKNILVISTSVTTFRQSVEDLIKLLADENGDRKEAFKKFGEDIENLSDKFKNINDNISKLTDLLNELNELDADKINKNLKEIDVDAINQIGTAGGSSYTWQHQLNADDVANAIREGIRGVSLSGGKRSVSVDSTDPAVKLIADALNKNTSYNINL